MKPYSSRTVPMSSRARGWVQRISNIFRNEVALNIDHLPPICVFEVPKTISVHKPQAYAPQLIAMGPYHHLRPELYQMERWKLAAVKEISTPEQIFNFQQLVINKLKEIDPHMRACYNKFLDYDQDALAWILAIDGCFFLHVAKSYLEPDETTDRRLLDNTIITRDLLMLENQIPFVLLKEIRKVLLFSNVEDGQEDVQLISLMLQLCESLSPVRFSVDKLNSDSFRRPLHLLNLMYHVIVNVPGYTFGPLIIPSHSSSSSRSSTSTSSDKEEEPSVVHNNFETILELVESSGSKRTQAIIRPVKVVMSIPWSSISGMFRKGNLGTDEENSEDDEIAIPSVSHLWRYAQVQFRPFIGSINEIKFDEEEAAFYLPVLNLNANSEVILRNLMAYEAAMSKSNLEFARYINLMNGIVDTAEDVKLLKQNGMIMGSLKDEEIADMFNSMKRCYVRSDRKSNMEIAIEKVNKYYDKKLVVRIARQLKRNLYISWRCMAVVSTVVLLLILTVQSFCEVYDCKKIWKLV